MRLLSHPFRLAAGGSVATVAQGTDAANIEQVAVLALTVAGERPMVPGFGVSDPVFAQFRPAELAAGLAKWGPPVQLGDVDVRFPSDATQRVAITIK